MTEKCKRCEGTGQRLVPSLTNKAPNLSVMYVPAPCGACRGTGATLPSEVEVLTARVRLLEEALDKATRWMGRSPGLVGAPIETWDEFVADSAFVHTARHPTNFIARLEDVPDNKASKSESEEPA